VVLLLGGSSRITPASGWLDEDGEGALEVLLYITIKPVTVVMTSTPIIPCRWKNKKT
jgi:hypothetical protein